MPRACHLPRTFLKGAAACALFLATVSAAEAASYRIALAEAGVYRVTYDDLVRAGAKKPLPSATLGLTNQGKRVPIHVRDGGDGVLGKGDWIEFVGEILPGETAHFNEYTSRNIYMLSTTAATPARMKRRPAPLAAAKPGPALPLEARLHLEQDLVLLRLSGNQGQRQELWHWVKLTQIDPEPFRQSLQLADVDTSAGGAVRVRLEFRGWSQPAMRPTAETKDHVVEVSVNGVVRGRTEWNNSEQGHLLVLPDIPASELAAGQFEVAIRVPPRPGQGQDSLVDVSLLNWIEVDYPRLATALPRQARLYAAGEPEVAPAPARKGVAPVAPKPSLRMLPSAGPSPKTFVVYGNDGSRWEARSFGPTGKEPGAARWATAGKARRFDVVGEGGLLSPLGVFADEPSRLKSVLRQADYVMVAHERLKKALDPLAAFHRARGLKVAVVDIQDVYDEFNGGILHPRALRDFLSYAYHKWKRPAPRWVLLVGDASWDAKNELVDEEHYPAATFSPGHGTQFAGIDTIPYANDAKLNHRNLVPTWSYLTYDGHAAGDNYFVSVDGNDDLPDMAIGRFTAVNADEVSAIVEKTINYAKDEAEWGPWRRRMLLITSEQLGFQYMSNAVADAIGKLGIASEKVYPLAESSSEVDQARLRAGLDEGNLLVHFVGHGGRYIWRTGPADWQKHRDLFNLDDIDQLKPSGRLPMVLSMTCYSAPFDHPSADSIGEKFLRVRGKGAVAVLAASWRNAPYQAMSIDVIEQLTAAGAPTIGEAIQRVKRAGRHREFLEQYNLLGDPALRLDVPRTRMDLTAGVGPESAPMVSGRIDAAKFNGRAIIDWLDAKGAVLRSEELTLEGPRFSAVRPGDAAAATAVRVYAWDQVARLDGAARVSLDAPASGETKGSNP
ncbi:MAG: C25 family cysteine peptidase [Vicinamibacteria bacterium]